MRKICRFCENLSPYESIYYDTTAIWMCWENSNSCDCGLDYESNCKHFELADVVKEVLGNDK